MPPLSSIANLVLKPVQWVNSVIDAIVHRPAGPPAPSVRVDRVRPGSGWPGSILKIEGRGFADNLDGNIVMVGRAACPRAQGVGS